MATRLKIEQVQAPNLLATSQILANAGKSFNDGLTTAQDTLGKYQTGQQTAADNSVMLDLANIKNEQELNAYLSSGALQGKNLSSEMRDKILGLRTGTIAFAQDRANVNQTQANTVATIDSNTRANAQEGRTANTYNVNENIRRGSAGLKDALTAAQQEANRYGVNGVPVTQNQLNVVTGPGPKPNEQLRPDMNTVMELARTIQAEAGNQGYGGMLAVGAVIRNRLTTGKYGNGLIGVLNKPGAFSSRNNVGQGYANGQQAQDMSFTPSSEAMDVALAIVNGTYTDPTNGATHYYNPEFSQPSWGKSGKWNQIGDHLFGNPDGINTVPVTQNTSKFPQFDALVEQINSIPDLPPEIAQRMINEAKAARDKGQGIIDQREAARLENKTAAALLNQTQDLNALNQADVRSGVLNAFSNESPSTRLGAAVQADQFTSSPTGSAMMAPQVPGDPKVAIAIANEKAAQQDSILRDPTTSLFSDAEKFNEDPVASLKANTTVLADGSNYNENDVNRYINQIASANGITRGEAVAAMVNIERQRSYNINNPALTALNPFALPKLGKSATLEKRFPPEVIKSFVEQKLTPEARQNYRDIKTSNSYRNLDFSSAQAKLNQLRTQLKKLNPNTPQAKLIQAEIGNLTDTVISGATPQEANKMLQDYVRNIGVDAVLRNTPPGSGEYLKTIMQLEESIKLDESLTNVEKTLLLKTIKGY